MEHDYERAKGLWWVLATILEYNLEEPYSEYSHDIRHILISVNGSDFY